ncbi:MAG: single-stranded DNA-binding protein [Candidatus Colwellbacteria bacterium CG10_big_fil_rev_8_21_14_0_10_41_28]|uniref:Single-stranded DNA-binding protein n=1 Tax=Candidatus Colwellbacteria bacterium CG10_big_fil_rev_8_21_14_0_10_41_28 TaxID=1974539 RepID=A0A2H0VGY8_9BACT|nr:MAG: single-stranded DNA-binding protein [Candidatus Colwellbacteria bacterium CG10_big_fil_rev_8_21_14_0_10_41_28]
MNLNKVYVAGRLTADPELRTTNSGDHVASFSIATNRYWRDKDGQKQEATEFHNIVVWGRQAEVVNQFSKKGSIILIEGRLQTRSWEGKDGQNRKTTEIVAENIQLGPRGSDNFSGGNSSNGGSSDSYNQERNDSDKVDQDKKEEDLPVINMDEDSSEDDIKPEDLPF